MIKNPEAWKQIGICCVHTRDFSGHLMWLYVANIIDFEASLGSQRKYQFRIVQTNTNDGNYSGIMIQQCSSLGIGWKPICDNPSLCRNDSKSIFIGQTSGSISFKTSRDNLSLWPTGWDAIKNYWNGLCVYTDRGFGDHALCEFPIGTTSWQLPNTKYPFMCGRGMLNLCCTIARDEFKSTNNRPKI